MFGFVCIQIFFFIEPFHFVRLFYYNHTDSLPIGWYLVLPTSLEEIRRGDIVVFEPPTNIKELAIERGWMGEDDLMMKRVGALEGDKFIVTDHVLSIENRCVGTLSKIDSQGRAMPSIRGGFIVRMNQFLPIGDTKDSFDGRYYGDIPMVSIHHKVIPLVTRGLF